MALADQRNALLPWYIGLVIIVLVDGYVGYQLYMRGAGDSAVFGACRCARGLSRSHVPDIQKPELRPAMIASAQISVYPLRQDRLGPAIETVREALADRGLKPEVGPMSTIVVGEDTVLFAAFGRGIRQSGGNGRGRDDGHCVECLPRCALTRHRPCRLLARRPVSLAQRLMRIGVGPRLETSPKRSSSVSLCGWRAR
jgi:hypothetical protein